MKYYGKIQDPKDLVTKEYTDQKIDDLKSAIEILVIPTNVKHAMDTLFSKVAYTDADAASSYATFHDWAYQVTSIAAVFTQGSAVIYDTDSLDTLKQYLTVTATYSDGTNAEVSEYLLSGTLETGTSVITVSYYGKSDAFDVTVTEGIHIVFLACRGVDLNGSKPTIITLNPNRTNRSEGLAQNGDTVQMQLTGGGNSGYYMIPIPAGATYAKLTKPSDIIWNMQICHYENNNGWVRDFGPLWQVTQELSIAAYNDGAHYGCINISKRGKDDITADANYNFTGYDFTNFSFSFI